MIDVPEVGVIAYSVWVGDGQSPEQKLCVYLEQFVLFTIFTAIDICIYIFG